MNQYGEDEEWMHSIPEPLSYHANLDNHHPIHSHAHTYPSQQVSQAVSSTVLDQHVAPILESPSYSQDRESVSETHEEIAPDEIPLGSTLPSYQLSHASLAAMPHTPPQGATNPFKRPYQPDPTPVSSPSQQQLAGPPNPKRRKSSASKEAWTMTEDDNLLLQLKDEEGLPWKAIAQRFRDMNRGEFRVPTLQMRYKRLKEKMRVWDADDIQYLKEAKEFVEKQKWEIISQKMIELGCKKKIPAATCERKWKEIGPQQPAAQSTYSQTPEMKRELSQVSDEGTIE